MAYKRRIEPQRLSHNERQEDDELTPRFKNIGWKEWLKEDFARYWFVTIALAIDALFGIGLMNSFPDSGLLGFVIFLAILIPAESYVYFILWGKKGRLMSQK